MVYVREGVELFELLLLSAICCLAVSIVVNEVLIGLLNVCLTMLLINHSSQR